MHRRALSGAGFSSPEGEGGLSFTPFPAYIKKLELLCSTGEAHQWAQAHFFVAGESAG
jgi:hypothetical protein